MSESDKPVEPPKCRHWWRTRTHYGSDNVLDCHDCHMARMKWYARLAIWTLGEISRSWKRAAANG